MGTARVEVDIVFEKAFRALWQPPWLYALKGADTDNNNVISPEAQM